MRKYFISKIKEMFLYGVWGVMTVLFDFVSYWLLRFIINNYKVATFISIVLTKVFAYVVNKKFVFSTKNAFWDEVKEIAKFILARGFTGVVEYFGQIILVDYILLDDMVAKILIIIITTILNYFLCSLVVFKNKES